MFGNKVLNFRLELVLASYPQDFSKVCSDLGLLYTSEWTISSQPDSNLVNMLEIKKILCLENHLKYQHYYEQDDYLEQSKPSYHHRHLLFPLLVLPLYLDKYHC